jgi:hypothetical protein
MTAFGGGCAAAELAYVTAFDCSTTHPDAVAVADTDHGVDSTPSHSPAD